MKKRLWEGSVDDICYIEKKWNSSNGSEDNRAEENGNDSVPEEVEDFLCAKGKHSFMVGVVVYLRKPYW